MMLLIMLLLMMMMMVVVVMTPMRMMMSTFSAAWLTQVTLWSLSVTWTMSLTLSNAVNKL